MKLRICVLALLPLAFVAVGVSQPADEPIQPIRPAEVTRPAVVELGKKLFFDPRLSKSGFISCNSCHNLSMGGSDNLQTSIGHNWQRGPINSPTVLNSSMSLAQFWDGRAKDLKEQAGGPIANPGEMAFTHRLALDVIASIPQYREEFTRAFGAAPIDIDRAQPVGTGPPSGPSRRSARLRRTCSWPPPRTGSTSTWRASRPTRCPASSRPTGP